MRRDLAVRQALPVRPDAADAEPHNRGPIRKQRWRAMGSRGVPMRGGTLVLFQAACSAGGVR